LDARRRPAPSAPRRSGRRRSRTVPRRSCPAHRAQCRKRRHYARRTKAAADRSGRYDRGRPWPWRIHCRSPGRSARTRRRAAHAGARTAPACGSRRAATGCRECGRRRSRSCGRSHKASCLAPPVSCASPPACRKRGTGAFWIEQVRRNPMPRIKHIALTTKEPAKVAAFYKDAFGMEEIRRAPNGAVFLTDGYINLAILNWKTEKSADVGANGPNYSGIHHFGFEVEDLDEAAAKLECADGQRLEEKEGLGMEMAAGGHRNFEMKWAGPDGVVIDISHTGWETKTR